MTVLLISFVFSPNLGGIETHLDDLVGYLLKRGHRITVITYKPLLSKKRSTEERMLHNLEIRRIPWFIPSLYHRLQAVPLLQMAYLIPPIFIYSLVHMLKNRTEYSVIQTHGFNMALVGAVLSSLFKISFTVNTHVSFQFSPKTLYSKILKIILNKAKINLVLTQDAKKELVRIGVRKDKIKIYHYWVDSIYKPLDKKNSQTRLGWEARDLNVLFVGRFIPEKGVMEVLRASRLVGPGIKFKFLGAGPLLGAVKKRVAEGANVYYEGVKTKRELPVFYSAADICIIPSLPSASEYTEGIPRVMIESFFCGTPVVGSRAGGLKDYIDDTVGFFIKPNATSMAKSLHSLYAKRGSLLAMRANCLIRAKREFSLKTNAKIIEQSLYD